MRVRGVYEWELFDHATGEVTSGSQENMVTDSLLRGMLYNSYQMNSISARLVLSTTSTPLPAGEYRAYGAAEAAIAETVVTTDLSVSSYDVALNRVTWQNNFATPGATRTIRIFGLHINPGAVFKFASFVELSTPITQTTTQSLFLAYSLFFDFASSGNLNAISNAWINTQVKRVFIKQFGGKMWIQTPRPRTSGNSNCVSWILTPWPVGSASMSKIARYPAFHTYLEGVNGSTYIESDDGTYHANRYKIDMATTDYGGPLGATCFGSFVSENVGQDHNRDVCLVVNPGVETPSISRIFAHPASRPGAIFNDPAYPPSSRGVVSLSGTPTNKWPYYAGRVVITKTGDASDIVGGAISGTSGNDYITVGESGWAVDDRITLAGGSLPAPLTAGTYWVVNVSGTDLKLSSTQGGGAITLSGSGSGTCERYNTGKYRLEYNSMPTGNMTTGYRTSGYGYTINFLNQLNMAIKKNGDPLEPAVITWGDNNWYPPNPIRVTYSKGDYVYSIQEPRAGTVFGTTYEFCRWSWKNAPLESSESILSVSNATVRFNSSCRGSGSYADIVFLGTNDGVYQWDLANPTVAPSKIAITGLVGNFVQDVCYDPVRDILWAGHSTGLSKINLGAGTATAYTVASGHLAGGLDSNEVNILPGSICDAYDGRLTICTDKFYYGNQPWILDDDYDGGGSQGWYRVGSDGFGIQQVRSNRLRVINRTNTTTWHLYDVTVTGKGTGSISTVSSIAASDYGLDYPTNKKSQIVRINDRIYGFIFHQYATMHYVVLDEAKSSIVSASYFNSSADYAYGPYEHLAIDECRTADEISRRGLLFSGTARGDGIVLENGEKVPLFSGFILLSSNRWGDANAPTYWDGNIFGWNGSAWEKENYTDRLIPKTATPALLSGVTAQFQNSVGQPWDTQFVAGERFCWMQGPVAIKDNLQTYSIKARYYASGVKRVTDWATTAAASILIPECATGSSPDADFRDLDTVDYVTRVYDVTGSVELTRSTNSSPPTGTYYMTLAGEFRFHSDQVGHSVQLSYNYTVF